MDVERGEFLAVTGPSGSGKSTFMHILGCLDRPTSGQYFLDGKDVSRLSKNDLARIRNHQIGFVFQGFNLLSRTTALENVELPLLYTAARRRPGTASAGRWRRSSSSASRTRAHHLPNQLSGGQQQRVAIARALINDPSILLADEPTGNLDTRTSIEVMGVFQRLNRSAGSRCCSSRTSGTSPSTARASSRSATASSDRRARSTKRRVAADELAALPPAPAD